MVRTCADKDHTIIIEVDESDSDVSNSRFYNSLTVDEPAIMAKDICKLFAFS